AIGILTPQAEPQRPRFQARINGQHIIVDRLWRRTTRSSHFRLARQAAWTDHSGGPDARAEVFANGVSGWQRLQQVFSVTPVGGQPAITPDFLLQPRPAHQPRVRSAVGDRAPPELV